MPHQVDMADAVTIGLANGESDLDGIIALQRANLEVTVGAESAARDGFVTVVHSREVLAAMHAICPSVVAKVGDEVVAYALVMPFECRPFVPILEPMFALLETLDLAPSAEVPPRPIARVPSYVMGQVCVAPAHRGTGLFDALYEAHREHFAGRWELCVTDVATRNTRSLRAHERVGFQRLATYTDATDTWVMVGLWLRIAR
jgi:GNAT superfamily N-acetyltransferase